jgi:hypothetical protein
MTMNWRRLISVINAINIAAINVNLNVGFPAVNTSFAKVVINAKKYAMAVAYIRRVIVISVSPAD